jgi:hypothetical protein
MLSEPQYAILDECKCGPEEFFVLVSSVYPGTEEELDAFLRVLTGLCEQGLLRCLSASRNVGAVGVSLSDLRSYIQARRAAGEHLDQHPTVVAELSFEATELGIAQLRPDDRPVRLQPG